MGKIVLTCVLALVFGFGGAVGAVTVMQDSLGADGVDGADGARGPSGKAGKAAKVTPTVLNLGIEGCTGRSVQVVTDVTITTDQKLRLIKRNVCVVK